MVVKHILVNTLLSLPFQYYAIVVSFHLDNQVVQLAVAGRSADIVQQLEDLVHEGDHVGVEVDHTLKQGAVEGASDVASLQVAKRARETVQDGQELLQVGSEGGVGVDLIMIYIMMMILMMMMVMGWKARMEYVLTSFKISFNSAI